MLKRVYAILYHSATERTEFLVSWLPEGGQVMCVGLVFFSQKSMI
jgi:hypothetical protein